MYQLWDIISGNIVGEFDDINKLIRFVFEFGQVNPTVDPNEFAVITAEDILEGK